MLIAIENNGPKPIVLPEEMIVNYEDDDDLRSNIYFNTYYWDNRYGLTAFNRKAADIDYVEDPLDPTPIKYVTLRPHQKMLLKRNPFDYSGIIEGEKNYRIQCAYRIRLKHGDIVYKSNYVDFSLK